MNELGKDFLYLTNQDDMRTGDRLEWHSNSVLGKIIRWKTGDWSNHTGMVIRFRDYEGTGKVDKRFTTEALERGVEINRLSKRLSKFDGEVMWYPLLPKFDVYRGYMGAKALDFVGTPYDVNSLLRQIYRHVPADIRKLFCSEYVFVIGRDAGLPVKAFDMKAPRPGKEMQALGWWGEGIRIK
jgi:hypothetical protein